MAITPMEHFDLCIVGAGVLGLAIARHFAMTRPDSFSILLLEKNIDIGQETSSRNSEVIHAGIYYPPSSLKAKLCVEGRRMLYRYCEDHGVAHRRIGKFIVAQETENERLEEIFQTAASNDVKDLQWVGKQELKVLEPLVRAERALFSPQTGIIDTHGLMQSLLQQASNHGVQYSSLTRVVGVETYMNGFKIHAECGKPDRFEVYEFTCSRLVNAAGLHSVELASVIQGLDQSLVPALHLSRGCYFSLSGKSPFQHLVYPLPEVDQKGLGIHATLDMAGQVRFGPDIEYVESLDYQVPEQRREFFVSAIQRYFPSLNPAFLHAAYSGIRPKLKAEGEGFADFVIQDESTHGTPGLVQLFGIESPGLTASLAIAKYVSDETELAE